jgi:diaminopimelate epimerase
VEVIRDVCARGSGVGADGIVFLLRGNHGQVAMRYLNADGSIAALCGNATLCTARLSAELGIVDPDHDFAIETDSGLVTARFLDGLPEIDLQAVTELQECFDTELTKGELRIGYALVGVPHLVILCREVDEAPVLERGQRLRHNPRLAHGANVNFVSIGDDGWRMRTYERGVEAETLACGTGAVAAALLLGVWGQASEHVELRTRSGRLLRVRRRSGGPPWLMSLSGEARIVFLGKFGELAATTT